MATKKTDRELCGLLSALARRIELHVRNVSENLNLTPPQAVALRELNEPMTVSELANRMCYETSNITTVLDGLEVLDYIQRTTHKSDRRVKILTLTKSGALKRNTLLQELSIKSPLDTLSAIETRSLKDIIDSII